MQQVKTFQSNKIHELEDLINLWISENPNFYIERIQYASFNNGKSYMSSDYSVVILYDDPTLNPKESWEK